MWKCARAWSRVSRQSAGALRRNAGIGGAAYPQAALRARMHGCGAAFQECRALHVSARCQEVADTNTAEASASSIERRILENALKHVATHRWTVAALAAGAADAGLSPTAHGMFAQGPVSLVHFFMDQCHQQMRETLQANAAALDQMRVAERLKFAIRTRLTLLQPVLSTWPQALALSMSPPHALTTLQKVARAADEIWYFAGDKSSDASWYTKRAYLTGIYSSTELFMLSDTSADFEETWRFLDRRMDRAVALGELPRTARDIAQVGVVGAQSLLSAVASLAQPLGQELVGKVLASVLSSRGGSNTTTTQDTKSSSFKSESAEMESADMRAVDQQLDTLGRGTA